MKRDERDGEVLTEAMSDRLLRRASELDAAARSGAKLTELRDAAAEAGISTEAFDAALAELQGTVPTAATQASVRANRRVWTSALIAGIVGVLAFITFAIGRATPSATAATVEQVFQLRCLTAPEAATLLRPILASESHGLTWSNANTNRVITVRASQPRMQSVRALIDKYDGADATACQISPLPTRR